MDYFVKKKDNVPGFLPVLSSMCFGLFHFAVRCYLIMCNGLIFAVLRTFSEQNAHSNALPLSYTSPSNVLWLHR